LDGSTCWPISGIAPKLAQTSGSHRESFDEVLGTNLRGPYFLTQTVARWMIVQRKPTPRFGMVVKHFFDFRRVAERKPREYCISKAVCHGHQALAARIREFGVPVYEVRTGNHPDGFDLGLASKYDRLLSEGSTIQPRWGTPEDVGQRCGAGRGDFPFLGTIFMVDGGLAVQRL